MRADLALVEQGLCPSRAQAQTLIEQGKVLLREQGRKTGVPVKKASQKIEPYMTLELLESDEPSFVSRGGLKLHYALERTGLKVNDLKCLDLGQSTGGFTDCLLQRGARGVVGIDVGKDQLHPSLKNRAEVLAMEGINLYKADIAGLIEEIQRARPDLFPVDLAVADLSFISLRKVLPNIAALMSEHSTGLFLVKPQFELGPEHIGKNGLVKKLESLASQLESDTRTRCAELNLTVKDFFACELKGGDGNQEYFVHTEKMPPPTQQPPELTHHD